MKLVQTKNRRTIQKLYAKFCKSYPSSEPPKRKVFLDPDLEFYIAYDNDVEVGHILLSNQSALFGQRVMCINYAFVIFKHRNKGYLRRMLAYSINNLQARIMHIEISRYFNNYEYYKTLGFLEPFAAGPSIQYVCHMHMPARLAAA